ncbi:MAG: hypothetical protein OXU74_09580 [Gemmatimonadota bacterium]|nr:hypothetical protein [Gemmatimonadota bacterium]
MKSMHIGWCRPPKLSILRTEAGTLSWIWDDFPQREELEQAVNLLGVRELVSIPFFGFGDPSYSHPSLSGEIEWSFHVEGRPASIVCQVTSTVSDDVTSASGQLNCPPKTWRMRTVDTTLNFGGSFSRDAHQDERRTARPEPIRRRLRLVDDVREPWLPTRPTPRSPLDCAESS